MTSQPQPQPQPQSQLSPTTSDALDRAELDVALVVDRVRTALDEDLAYGPDVTTLATVPPEQHVEAVVSSRAPGVVAGLPVAMVTLDLVVGADAWSLLRAVADGTAVNRGDVVMQLRAPTRELLTAERTLLNFLCHLSGVATQTAAWAAAAAPAKVRDTRKTMPGLRVLQKYAVRCGGGVNHRLGLGDAALVKDNHVLSAGGVGPAVEAIRRTHSEISLEVECDSIAQVREAIAAGVDLILLDNMSAAEMRECVQLAEKAADRRPVRFEASGRLTLSKAREVAATGVDFLAVGALTHSAPVLDLGLDVERAVAGSVGSVGDRD
ncbi:MAG TPA: carboxylating nicotinate-nucleotide diphosphorylase [Actinomycetes bacterium]|nr:carboxylating nicotinate-nucleotide diphosphorylase [Actinomycetes bacterium]